jgi:hypothetical protein
LAEQRVKQQLRDAGIKLSSIERRELMQRANDYLAEHPQLLVEAAEKIEATPSLKKIAEQEERRRAKLVSDAQRRRPCSTTGIPVHMSSSQSES